MTQEPSEEQLRLHVEAMRDMALKLTRWARVYQLGSKRHNLWLAATLQTSSADAVQAALKGDDNEQRP